MGRVIVVGDDHHRLSLKNKQVIAEPRASDYEVRTAPCEDLDLILVDSTKGCALDTHLIRQLVDSRTVVVFTDTKHVPAALLVPFNVALDSGAVNVLQFEQSKPRRKRAWQQLIQAKIRGQAIVVSNKTASKRLTSLAESVKSGDPDNVEATAARLYWHHLEEPDFHRIPRSRTGLNGLLDFGYAVVRSLLARELVIAGLDPSIPIHHSSRVNRLALCDDLIEPIRPFVDRHALQVAEAGGDHRDMIKVVHSAATNDDLRGDLSDCIGRFVASYKRYVTGSTNTLDIPRIDVDGTDE